MKDCLHIYTRVSTSIQEDEGTSLKTQKEIGIELSKKLGMTYQIHDEGGMSSSKDNLDNRPVLLNILKGMDDGIIKNLYVWNTDRLSRNQITWYTIRQKMVKNGVVLYTSNCIHKTTDFMENMILGILSEVSQYDNQVRMERSRLGKIEKVKLNYWRGGDCPFGYKLGWDGRGNKLVEDDNESKWLRYIFTEYSKGTSLKDIKSVLHVNGIKTRRGNELWSMGSLQVMLRNEIYLGNQIFVDKKSKIVIRNTIPQLVSNTLWDEVQQRRNSILVRRNQVNRTKKFYLFRDFLICKCGTPMGGRCRLDKGLNHYYCPLPERKFNNNYKNDVHCDMKRGLNIPTTDGVLWNKIIDILSDTMELKNTLTKMTSIGKLGNPDGLKVESKTIEDKIRKLLKIKSDIEKGIVEIETKKILQKYPSNEVYLSLRKSLTNSFNTTKSDIEKLRSSLQTIGDQQSWFLWIENFGKDISEKKHLPDPLKKVLLKQVLDCITVDYDWKEKVHRLNISFKIPVFQGDGGEKYGRNISGPSETLGNQPDQLVPVETYSTVIKNTSKGTRSPVGQTGNISTSPTKGYSLRMSVELTSSNLWTSTYSSHQQRIFGFIRKLLDGDRWNFKQI